MKKNGFRKVILFAGTLGALLLVARCSPNTSSISKATLADIQSQKNAPIVDTGDSPPIESISLRTHLLTDEQSFREQTATLGNYNFPYILAEGDPLDAFEKNGILEIALPKHVQTPARGDAYLWVDLTEDEKSSIGTNDFQLSLKRSLNGANRWNLVTSPDKNSPGVQRILPAIQTLIVVLPQSSPLPAASPSPAPSPSPNP